MNKNARQEDPGAPFRIFFVSLGCEKNLVDSEQMIGLLEKRGYVIVNDVEDADIAVVNSCCFIGDAKEETIDTVIELGGLKEDGVIKGIILTGCLAQRYADEIKTELPEVDAVVGTTSIDSIADAADRVRAGFEDPDKKEPEDIRYIESPDRYVFLTGCRRKTGLPHTAYLKIADGCDKRCTYCVIPSVRGRYRSVPMEDLLQDAENLASNGAGELIVVAQETTLYGTDIYGRKALPELLKKLAKIPEIEWIRLMYCYPEEITDDLIECIKEEPKICRCLDIPIQHCSDRILKLMGRKTDKEAIKAVVKKIREGIPGVAIRTTLISGFPTETKEEHAELLDFVKEMRFERLGDFAYSAEEGTPAAAMEGQIPEETRQARRDEIMNAQQQVVSGILAAIPGKTLDVLVEGRSEEGFYLGRTFMDAPDIDGYVFFDSERKNIMSGEIVKVLVEDTDAYDLFGREVRE